VAVVPTYHLATAAVVVVIVGRILVVKTVVDDDGVGRSRLRGACATVARARAGTGHDGGVLLRDEIARAGGDPIVAPGSGRALHVADGTGRMPAVSDVDVDVFVVVVVATHGGRVASMGGLGAGREEPQDGRQADGKLEVRGHTRRRPVSASTKDQLTGFGGTWMVQIHTESDKPADGQEEEREREKIAATKQRESGQGWRA